VTDHKGVNQSFDGTNTISEVGREPTFAPTKQPINISAETVTTIVTRRAAGDLAADIGRDLGITPLDVLDIVREVRRGERLASPEVVELALQASPVRQILATES
jgi:hypothetical protein